MSSWRSEFDACIADEHAPVRAWLRVLALQNAELLTTLRPLALRDDYETAATSQDVCLCEYKPYPHPKFPPHPNAPKPLVAEVESV